MVLVDTSIVWHIAFNTVVAPVARGIVSAMRSICDIVYTRFNEEDVLLDEKLDKQQKEKLLSAYASIATRIEVKIDRERVLGRFARWVRKLGPRDVLIAVSAQRLGAFLLTADWGQTRLVIESLGRRVIYVPLHELRKVCRSG